MKSLTTSTADGVPAEVAGAVSGFADIVPTIWGGLDLWAQWAVVILIIVVVVICLRPVISEAPDRNSSMVVAIIGVALLAYAIIKWIDAGDKADEATAGLVQSGIPAELFSISRGVGFLILIIGTVLVTFAGAMGFMSSDDD